MPIIVRSRSGSRAPTASISVVHAAGRMWLPSSWGMYRSNPVSLPTSTGHVFRAPASVTIRGMATASGSWEPAVAPLRP